MNEKELQLGGWQAGFPPFLPTNLGSGGKLSGATYLTSTIAYLAPNLPWGQRSVAQCSISGWGKKI